MSEPAAVSRAVKPIAQFTGRRQNREQHLREENSRVIQKCTLTTTICQTESLGEPSPPPIKTLHGQRACKPTYTAPCSFCRPQRNSKLSWYFTNTLNQRKSKQVGLDQAPETVGRSARRNGSRMLTTQGARENTRGSPFR